MDKRVVAVSDTHAVLESKVKDGRRGSRKPRTRDRAKLRLCTTYPSVPVALDSPCGQQPPYLRARATLRIAWITSDPLSRRFPLLPSFPPCPVEEFIHGPLFAGQSAPKSAQLQDNIRVRTVLRLRFGRENSTTVDSSFFPSEFHADVHPVAPRTRFFVLPAQGGSSV